VAIVAIRSLVGDGLATRENGRSEPASGASGELPIPALTTTHLGTEKHPEVLAGALAYFHS
jgi:hypothetical protein